MTTYSLALSISYNVATSNNSVILPCAQYLLCLIRFYQLEQIILDLTVIFMLRFPTIFPLLRTINHAHTFCFLCSLCLLFH